MRRVLVRQFNCIVTRVKQYIKSSYKNTTAAAAEDGDVTSELGAGRCVGGPA